MKGNKEKPDSLPGQVQPVVVRRDSAGTCWHCRSRGMTGKDDCDASDIAWCNAKGCIVDPNKGCWMQAQNAAWRGAANPYPEPACSQIGGTP